MKLTAIFASILFVCVFILLPDRSAHSAEIININYKYRIAFADLTENDVKAGDLVTVITPDGVKSPLKVVETYPVMVKLTVADGDGAVTDEQFASIPVGSQVVVTDRVGKAARVTRKPEKIVNETGAGSDDTPSHVERYSPGAATAKDPIGEPRKTDKASVVASEPSNAGNRTSGTTTSEISAALPGSLAVPPRSEDSRCSVLEQRMDQMLTNNVKLTESLTQILSEKNASESRARDKEAAARVKTEELVAANAALSARLKDLGVSMAAAEQDKAAKQKEIESLNLKLGELKKKLAKMVEIVNTNMKAYEK